MPVLPAVMTSTEGAISKKMATEALRLAVLEPIRRGKHAGKVKLRRIGEVIAENAMKGEPWACTLVYDRLDGKALQPIAQNITHDLSQVFIDVIRAINSERIPERLTIEAIPNGQGEAASLVGPREGEPRE